MCMHHHTGSFFKTPTTKPHKMHRTFFEVCVRVCWLISLFAALRPICPKKQKPCCFHSCDHNAPDQCVLAIPPGSLNTHLSDSHAPPMSVTTNLRKNKNRSRLNASVASFLICGLFCYARKGKSQKTLPRFANNRPKIVELFCICRRSKGRRISSHRTGVKLEQWLQV